ncbi:MAG: hypothetical protein A6D91_03800 [Bacillaceae bacterium G1]|nr:hypothetical protein [Bacillota bacterium]OJF17351.1 MAG: hypothetical protein A6D91_03800 [Bacillaceae bacterium G1]
MDFWWYILLALAVLWLVLRYRPVSGLQQIDARTLREKMQRREKLKIVDVREPVEFQAGHIPGAVNLPLGRLPYVAKKELHPEEEIVLVCRSGRRSMVAARRLRKMGYTKLYNLTGGMVMWERTQR